MESGADIRFYIQSIASIHQPHRKLQVPIFQTDISAEDNPIFGEE